MKTNEEKMVSLLNDIESQLSTISTNTSSLDDKLDEILIAIKELTKAVKGR